MTKKIFKSICVVAISVFLASLVIIMGVLYEYFAAERSKSLKSLTLLTASAVEESGPEYLKNLDIQDYRIAYISSDGTVLYDNKSDTKKMENHLQREEVKKALATGYGESERYSTTLTERQLYSAKKLSNGNIIRLSCSEYTWLTLLITMCQPIIAIIAIAVGLSLFLAFRLSKKIVEPLNNLNLDDPKKNNTYEELTPLIDRLTTQQQLLKQQEKELNRKKREFETATKNMSEGIVLLNKNGSVLSINNAACNILNISGYCVGKDLVLFLNNAEIKELILKAQNGKHCESNILINNNSYLFNTSPIVTDNAVVGIALIILNITEKEKSEKMRKEFTANVSHELKTPLQSILGYAELLKNNIAKPEDRSVFIDNIYGETKRLIALIEDIINLSFLDENANEQNKEKINLYKLCQENIKLLTPKAKDLNVSFNLTGKSTYIIGVKRLVNEIIYNLCDNAVKYNKPGGEVSVSVKNLESTVVLSVKDTGIGIKDSDKERIFERFYRVDKSRSKKVGGTGLGLSIVKHAAIANNANITVESTLNKGTEIKVIFNK